MQFIARSVIRATPERVFAFHELPDALERLTPAWAGSRIIQSPSSLDAGARSIVEIRVAPFVWVRTELMHVVYEPPALFVDEQVRGPFKSWRHQHRFTKFENGTELADVIDFEPPLGLITPLIILPRLRRLFAYRHDVTRAWCE